MGHVLTPRGFSRPFPECGPGLTAHPGIYCSAARGGMKGAVGRPASMVGLGGQKHGRRPIGRISGKRHISAFFDGLEFALRRFCGWLNGVFSDMGPDE
jgi:hypothetical protein